MSLAAAARRRPSARAYLGRTIATQAVLALLALGAGLAFAPAFGGRLVPDDFAPGGIVTAALVGALVPAVLVTGALLLEFEAVLAAVVGLVGTAVVVALVTRPGTAVFAGAYRLLTSALPAEADGPGTATVAGLTGFAALIAALIAGYSRLRALAVVPALAVLVGALALDAGIREPPVWYAAVVLVLMGASLALVRPAVNTAATDRPRTRSLRAARAGFPVVGAVAVLAAGGVLAAAFTTQLPAVSHRAADARNLVPAPLRPRSAVNPMLQDPAFAQGTQAVRLTGTSSRRLRELTLVTLDGFTGQTWTTSARFRRAGRTLSDVRESPSVTLDVQARDVSALSWLVRPDRPTSLNRDGLGINESTDDLVVPGGVKYPSNYRVTGTLPRTVADLPKTARAVRRRGPVATDPTKAPSVITAFAQRVRSESNDYLKLVSLQVLLREQGFYVDDTSDAPSGNGYFQIANLLRPSSKHLGTSEQYASAFAVMARMIGFDARLVLGFRPEYGTRGNAFSITGRDVHAWAQVRMAGEGWVTFDPTPSAASSKSKPTPTPGGVTGGPSGTSANASSSASHTPPPPKPTPKPPRAQRDEADSVDTTLIAAIAAAAVVLLLVLTPPSVKARRRHRRRAAGAPARAVFGAWSETTDRLAEVGVPRRRARLTSELADAAPPVVRADVSALGRLLDRAGYAPESAGPDDARAAWTHADRAAHTLRAGMPWWRRVLAWLDPRPLRRR